MNYVDQLISLGVKLSWKNLLFALLYSGKDAVNIATNLE